MKRRKEAYILLVSDCAVVLAAYVLALKLHAPAYRILPSGGLSYLQPEILFFTGYSGVIVLIFLLNQLYKINVYLSVTRQLQYLAKSLFYSAIGIAILSFFTKSELIVDSRLVMLYFLLISFTMLTFVRVLILRTIFRFLAAHEIFPRTVAILGAGPAGVRLGRILAEPNEYDLRLVGFLDDTNAVGSNVVGNLPVLGTIDEIKSVVVRSGIKEIIFCMEGASDEKCLDVLDVCATTRALVMVGSEQFAVIPRRLNLESYGDVPVFKIMNGTPKLTDPLPKMIVDRIGALLMLALLSPLFLATALAVKLDSRGPVLFKQTRVGKNGREFTFYKFRSMVVGSDRDDGREEKLRQFIGEKVSAGDGSTKIVDERKVTRVGRFIRKTSIDELPQLVNVLKGDMSLVGPRPCLPYEWKHYASWHKRRLSVMPGCTGVWQVLGRSEVGFRDMVILDLFYVYNMSFHLDVWLLLKTIPVMLFGTGAR